VRSYYKYASYGRQDISVEVFGPIKYTMTGCNTSKLTQDLRAMIPGQFQHYLWYLGSRNNVQNGMKVPNGCGWAGLASVGTPDRPSKDTWYNASTGCVVLVQEPGHNFGMSHSSSMTCGTQTFVDDPMTTCRHSEYGDRFDPMGGGCRHMNAWQKAYQGWYGPCNGIKVGSSATFTLLSNGKACDGAQFLQIPAPKVRMMPRSGGGGSATVDMLSHYYVEFRGPDNFDGTLGWRNMPQAGLAPQVHVRIGGDLKGRTQRGLHTWLLDMVPGTASNADAALTVGKTYTDPAGGLSITVMAVDANQATIKVEMTGSGMNTCMDGAPFQAPGPGPESCQAIDPTGDGGVISTDGGGMMPIPDARGDVNTGTGGRTNSGDANAGSGGSTPMQGSGGASGATDGPVVGGSGGGGVTGPKGPDAAVPSVGDANLTGGCGCRTAEGTAPIGLGTLAFGMLLVLGRRRRLRR
jgi:MYXO-CTERM domain-containing protein